MWHYLNGIALKILISFPLQIIMTTNATLLIYLSLPSGRHIRVCFAQTSKFKHTLSKKCHKGNEFLFLLLDFASEDISILKYCYNTGMPEKTFFSLISIHQSRKVRANIIIIPPEIAHHPGFSP